MGYQIIKQPNGKLALFSSYSDTFIGLNMSNSDVVDFFVEEAEQRARESVERILDHVNAGKPRYAYAQFALTWDDAVKKNRKHKGELKPGDFLND